MAKKRGRPKKEPKKIGPPQPCQDCGKPGKYYTDPFGMISDLWRCEDCHEQAVRRLIRNEYHIRYGDR